MTAGSQGEREPSRRARRATVAALVATGLVSSSVLMPGLAAAAVPAFPDNIVVFPNRDMVVLEGFEGLVGKTVTIEVYGGTTLKGSVTGVPAAGAEFEINHPGGLCWGVGAPAGLNVTPNIVGGDRVVVKQDGAEVADTTVQDVEVVGAAGGTGGTVTVQSRIGDVNKAQLEQRIVNPELTDTAVGRRDLRALPGGLIVDGNGAYQSGLDVATGLATYEFTDATIAGTARSGGGERIMAWQSEDADGNRQGLTIAEAGEPGGPGMGGCPAGPGDIAAPAPGDATYFRSTDKTSMQVKWTAATPVAGAAPIIGYNVQAIAKAAEGATEQVTLGMRTSGSATGTTITGLKADTEYTIEVRSLTDKGALSAPLNPTAGTPTQTGEPPAEGDKVAPEVTASATAPVTFTGLGAGEELYYTLDGSAPNTGDMPSINATRYTGTGIAVPATATLKWAAFDAAGNYRVDEKSYTVEAAAALTAPTSVTVTGGAELANVNWTAPAQAGTSPITKYVVTATPVAPATGAPVVVEAGAAATSIDVKPLVGNTKYGVTVAAVNAQGTGAASTAIEVTPTVNTVPRVSIGTARWKAGDFRVTGTTSAPVGTLVRVYRGVPSTNNQIASGNAVAGALAGSQDYSIRARNNAAPATNPGAIYVTVTVNGVTGTAGPFTTTNG